MAYGPITNEAADHPTKETFAPPRRRRMYSTTVCSSSRSLWELFSWYG